MVIELNATRVPDIFFYQVSAQGDRVALRQKDYGIWNRITWREYGKQVSVAGAALLSMGVKKGERVAIIGDNSPEWMICHLAIMCIGCSTCGIYPTSSSLQLAYLLNHSESVILFAENEEQVDKILEILPEIEVELVVIWENKGLWGFNHEKFVFYNEFMDRGEEYIRNNPNCIDDKIKEIDPEDIAMIIYTSGTTGPPKGAMISHSNIMSMVKSFSEAIPFYERDEMISYLPLAHIYENLISLFQAIKCGGVVNFVESPDTLGLNLREVSPTILQGVPRIWEKFASLIEIRMSDSTILKKALYRLAIKTGMKYIRAKKGTGERFLASLLYWFMYWLVLYHLKRQLGLERVRYAICGAAPASTELFEFYNALGVPLREGYGQTESTGVIALQLLDRPRWGYVGEPVPDMEVRISDEGEILVKGPSVFKGYFKDPELTKSTIIDGWLYTGDVGIMDEGFLKIIDRKKDIIITAGGKNITPAYIENKLKFSSYIQDSVVIGDGRRYITALILIDEDNVTKYAQDHRIPFTTFADLTRNGDIRKLIDSEISGINKTLSSVESIKKFDLLPRRLYEEDGDVTPTKKVKRRFLEERYAGLIEKLYNN